MNVLLVQNNVHEGKNEVHDGLFVLICTLYLLIGLSLLAMCFHLTYEYKFPWCSENNCEKIAQYNSSWVYNDS